MGISGIKWTVTIMSSIVLEDKEMARASGQFKIQSIYVNTCVDECDERHKVKIYL